MGSRRGVLECRRMFLQNWSIALIGSSEPIESLIGLLALNGFTPTTGQAFARSTLSAHLWIIDYQSANGVAGGSISPGTSALQYVLINVPEVTRITMGMVAQGLRGAFFITEDGCAVLRGVFRVLEGEFWFPRCLIGQWLAAMSSNTQEISANGFTPRERQIVNLVSSGATTKEMSKHLCISPFTVRTHLQNVFSKTGARNRIELLQAIKHFGL